MKIDIFNHIFPQNYFDEYIAGPKALPDIGKRVRNMPTIVNLDARFKVMDEFGDSPALDAGLLAGAQAVEHYEISRYGTLKTWAGQMGLNAAVKLLDQTLQEEKKTDELLTRLATEAVNRSAAA